MIDRSTAERLTEVLREIVREARAATSTLGPSSLPGSIVTVLGALSAAGEQRLGRLAELMGVDLSVASRHTAAAIERGYVERRPDPDDGRASLLRVSAEGEKALAAHRAARVEWLQSLAGDWSDEDARRLLEGLTRLRDDVRAARRAHAEALTPSSS